jgi:hypothetical protein
MTIEEFKCLPNGHKLFYVEGITGRILDAKKVNDELKITLPSGSKRKAIRYPARGDFWLIYDSVFVTEKLAIFRSIDILDHEIILKRKRLEEIKKEK